MKLKLVSMILVICVAAQPAAGMSGTVKVHAAQVQADGNQAVRSDSETKVQGDFAYRELSDGTIEIAHYNGTDAALTIPAEIDGRKVSRIGDSAFAECESIKSVEVPDGVVSLMDYAFALCKNLQNITLPESVTYIGEQAFLSCGRLETVKIPDNVGNIGWDTFAGCTRLISVQMPENLETIAMGAFRDCKALTSISLPEGTRQIGEAAFRSCSSLQSISLPKSLKEIAQSAFESCSKLKKVSYAGSKTERKNIKVIAKGNETLMGANVRYQNSDKLSTFAPKAKAIIKSGKDSYKVLTKVSAVAFSKTARKDSSLVVPEYVEIDGIVYNVEAVASGAFANNKNVSQITIKGDIRQISSNAFRGCSKLKTTVIKSRRLKTVGSNAWEGTPQNSKIKVPAGEVERYKKLLKGKGIGKKTVIVEY